MTRVRPPAVAGTFYPRDPAELAATVDLMLEDALPLEPPSLLGEPRALVVPHAGYAYSGPVAASAYARLIGAEIGRVVVLGPAHFVPLRGCTVPSADAWETPLGEVAVDEGLRDAATTAGAAVDDRPHEPEHAIEVQLPFLQRRLPASFTALPVAVGSSRPEQVAGLIDALGDDVLVVVSTDLSHYHDHRTARLLDRRTADAVLALTPEAIGSEDACGGFALRGLLEHARRAELEPELLDLRTSAATSGDPRRVVGYGAFAFRARAPGSA